MVIKIKFPHEDLCRRASVVLGIPRKDVKETHPDHGGCQAAFRELVAAYESAMLMLPNLRRSES